MPTPKISRSPSPNTFAEALKREVIEPAAQQVAGDDGVLDQADRQHATLTGAAAYAKASLDEASALTGSQAPDVAAFVDAATERARSAAADAAGPDGRLSKSDVEKLPQDLRVAFHYLQTGEAVDAVPPATLTVPARDGVRFSAKVFTSVAEAYGLSDGEALLDKALELGDGNAYVNRKELEAAAEALNQGSTDPDVTDPVVDPPVTDAPAEYRYAESVLSKVMDQFGITDREGLLEVATRHDLDGNRYLKRSELEAAAKDMTDTDPSAPELGIISDIDKTLLPPHGDNDPLPPAYPGVSFLIGVLEHGIGNNASFDPPHHPGAFGNGRPGDTHYVTARTPDRITDIPAWFSRENLPTGDISTGVSGIPWVAQAEKVRDISAVFDANPDQKYILFGDSSHRDPEVYREIKAKYPDRVIAGFIHKVNNPSASRVEGLHLITNYAEAAAILLGKGVLDEGAARAVMVRAQAEGLTITDAEIDALIDAAVAAD
jgi:hypothetical protein